VCGWFRGQVDGKKLDVEKKLLEKNEGIHVKFGFFKED
jgi:hypothetical protein